MYTGEDLDAAVAAGVFTKESVLNFRNQMASFKKLGSEHRLH